MKTYSIGRDLSCDIVINDSTDVISRRHALLNITSSGKMTIIDQSSNGTYVNGIRVTQNVPVPVTRKDIVSLAHVAKLDWNQVPKSNQWIKYVIGAVAVAVVMLGVVLSVKYLKQNSDNNDDGSLSPIQQVDSTAIKQKEAARLDSIKNVERQDSIKKALEKEHQGQIKGTRKAPQTKKEIKKEKREDKSKDTKGKGKPANNKKRTIG